MSKREQIFLAVAMLVVSGFLYGYFRVRTALTHRSLQLGEIATNKSRILQEAKSRPSPPEIGAEAWDEQYAGVQRSEAIEREALDEFEKTFADLGDQQSLLRLKRRITDLARSNQVAVLKNVPYVPTKRGAETTSAGTASSQLVDVLREWERPLDRLTVESSFANLQAFLGALKSLSSRVLVVSVSLEVGSRSETAPDAAGESTERPETLLTANLVVSR